MLLLKNYSLTLFIYNIFFKIRNKRRFYNEINKRKNTSIFNYKELSQPVPFYPIEKIKDANFYGVCHCLKWFSGVNRISPSIEHGLYLGNYVPFATKLKTTKSIITFSNNRKKHLINANIDKPIFTIGPYIHYAYNIISDKRYRLLKNSLGKTLLLFPSHSINNFNVINDIQELINKTIKIASNYDTVMVCLFYKDIINDIYPRYFEEAGFKIVTAGHKYDLNFLSRLKLIIQLADLTISSTIGTHTGYCIYLNKPHYVIQQQIIKRKDNDCIINEIRNDEQLKTFQEEEKVILNEFIVCSEVITENQKEIIDKYWGIKNIKTPEQLRNILTK